MISCKHAVEDEFEGPPTPEDPLIRKVVLQSCEQLGPRPYGLAFRSSKSLIILAVCMAVFTDAFLYTLIIPILPEILTKKANVPPEEVQKWSSILLSAFGAANLITSPLAGYMTDRTSTRKAPLLYGLYALTGATAMFSFGKTPMTLVIARGLQGASASVIWVVGLALLSDTMGASNCGEAMGWQGVGRFAGALLGPSLGGIVYDFAGHYAVFGMAFAVLLFDIVLRFAMIERKVAEQWISFPETVSYHATDSTESLGEERPQSPCDTSKSPATGPSRHSLSGIIGGHASGVGLLLSSSRILAALWTYFACSVIMTALECVLSIYTMKLFNWTASQSGLIFVMLSFSVIIDPYIGRLTDVHGCRGITVSGVVLGIAVWIALCFVTTNTIACQIGLAVLIFVLGFSTALMVTPNMVEISHAVDAISQSSSGGKADPAKVMGRAYSLLNMSWALGSIFGPLLGGGVIEKWGWVSMCITFVVLQVFTAGFAFRYAGGRSTKVEESE